MVTPPPGKAMSLAPIATRPVAPKPSSPSERPPNSSPCQLSTSKVWVVPPRPKPGRKPAADAPQNKRKAQNRAAQRAFRERRAQALGEMEERLNEMRKEMDMREAQLNAKLKNVIRENEDLKKTLSDVQSQQSRANSPSSYPSPYFQVVSPASSSHGSPYMDVLDRALEDRLPVNSNNDGGSKENNDDRCVVCTKAQCLCEDVGLRAPPAKKARINSEPATPPSEPDEIDFTEMYARPQVQQSSSSKSITGRPAPVSIGPTAALVRRKPVPQTSSSSSSSRFSSVEPMDKCGFCVDGAPCLCAEAALNDKLDDDLENVKLPPLQLGSPLASPSHKLPALHTDGTPSTLSVPASPISSSPPSNECTGDPGTCMQCQTDPMSTLFCSTVASKAPPRPGFPSSEQGKTYIPCSVAYRTLSRHKDFRSADLSTIIGKLNTRGMQVEVNSVANVLRELDRKLYN